MATIEENGVLTISGSGEMRDFKYYEESSMHEEKVFNNSIMLGNKVIIFPYDITKSAWIFNLDTRTFLEKKWYNLDNSEENKEGKVEYIDNNKESVYLPISETACIIELNTNDFTYDIIKLDDSIAVSSILVEKDIMWLTQTNTTKIIRYQNGYSKEIDGFGVCERGIPFSRIAEIADKIFFLSRTINEICIYDKVKEKLITKKLPDELCEHTEVSNFLGYYVDELKENLYLLPWRSGGIYRVTCDTNEIGYIEMEISLDEFVEMKKLFFAHESQIYHLKEYIMILNRE